MNRFTVDKVDNGFVVSFVEKVEVGKDDDKWSDFEERRFIFDSPAKLKKGLKLIVAKLTQEGV